MVMNGINITLTDCIAKEHNKLLNENEANLSKYHIYANKKIECGAIDLDQLFDGWEGKDIDFILGDSISIISNAFKNHKFYELPMLESAIVDLYFGMLKLKAADGNDIDAVMRGIALFNDLSNELLIKKHKSQKEKPDSKKDETDEVTKKKLTEDTEKKEEELRKLRSKLEKLNVEAGMIKALLNLTYGAPIAPAFHYEECSSICLDNATLHAIWRNNTGTIDHRQVKRSDKVDENRRCPYDYLG